ncbi:MAG: DUF2157 domain-containing protein [Acidobacteria bacterium]|nr:DUF2157 domain-containing protein [Acidobacteriota bacterium]MBV9068094.1 DUF2157 domain-containing protein [Acidobacteriota bacterium]MBV9185401.1 DUF2157 domain-containing protein [Acidobacteriota bacterium]
MITLEPELALLRDGGTLDAETAAVLIARERRDAVSIYPELRLLTWAGVMLITTGVGVYVAKHLDDIGPLAIAVGIGLAAAACYAWAYWKRSRTASLVDDYVLLLAALLASADVGYIEHHYHLLGDSWPRHFLFLAILHAVTAYYFQSRFVLSLSVASLAAWLGIERRSVDAIFDAPEATAGRAFVCAAIVVAWRVIDRKLRPATTFSSFFDHAAANFAFWGSLALAAHKETRLAGCLLTVILAAASMLYARRTRNGTFVIYAWVYGTIAIDIAVLDVIHDPIFNTFYMLISTIAAIVGLFLSHARLRRAA